MSFCSCIRWVCIEQNCTLCRHYLKCIAIHSCCWGLGLPTALLYAPHLCISTRFNKVWISKYYFTIQRVIISISCSNYLYPNLEVYSKRAKLLFFLNYHTAPFNYDQFVCISGTSCSRPPLEQLLSSVVLPLDILWPQEQFTHHLPDCCLEILSPEMHSS